VDLGPLLRAHGYLQVERPPALWDVNADDELLIRMLGVMISAALVPGTELGDIVLRANNVTATEADGVLAPGDYVALSIAGAGDWSPEVSWFPDSADAPVLVNADMDAAARAVGVRWGYTRAYPAEGSVTVLLPRLAAHIA
jgi:hypothetical protein